MSFTIGVRVHVTVDKEFADGKKITAGTCGTVRDVYDIFNACLIKFDGVGLPRMIANDELAGGCKTDE